MSPIARFLSLNQLLSFFLSANRKLCFVQTIFPFFYRPIGSFAPVSRNLSFFSSRLVPISRHLPFFPSANRRLCFIQPTFTFLSLSQQKALFHSANIYLSFHQPTESFVPFSLNFPFFPSANSSFPSVIFFFLFAIEKFSSCRTIFILSFS